MDLKKIQITILMNNFLSQISPDSSVTFILFLFWRKDIYLREGVIREFVLDGVPVAIVVGSVVWVLCVEVDPPLSVSLETGANFSLNNGGGV